MMRREHIAGGIAALLLWLSPLYGLDTLMVGAGAGGRNWRMIREFSESVKISRDSIWLWNVEAGENLALRAVTRGGGGRVPVLVWHSSGQVEELVDHPGLVAWFDGDETTAWSPDEDDEVDRLGAIFLDLGSEFGIDRIRFLPRLDSEHRSLILGSFDLGILDGSASPDEIAQMDFKRVTRFSRFFPNQEPVVDFYFQQQARYIRLLSDESEPWEIAELEVYSDGTVPGGEFVSEPMFIRGGYPIWGRMLVDGRDARLSSIAVQTRTGPDYEPVFYFLKRGDELEQVPRQTYLSVDQSGTGMAGFDIEVEQGPVLPNPAWSQWQTVTEGQVMSPGPQRYMQFRIALSEPGISVESLSFEYVDRPLVDDLAAEISPLVVAAGEEVEFTLSLEVHVDAGRGDTGFRYLQVLTPAVIHSIERVLVDDEEVVFTPFIREGGGFAVDIWQRVVQEGSFVQLVFRATVLRDGTAFLVRSLDRRMEEEKVEEVYQTAREADVDPLSVGGQLVVRLIEAEGRLVDQVRPRVRVFSPNGDGVHDLFEVQFNILKLTEPAPVRFELFDMGGRQVRGKKGEGVWARNGRFVRLWDGRDDEGELVEPGVYIYRIQVDGDVGSSGFQGVVGVVY